MGIDALRTMALEVTFNVLGVAVTLTRPVPNDVAIETTAIWEQPLEEEQPYGHDVRRLDARRVMAFTRTVADSGKMMERFESACGQIGVSAKTSAVGKTIAPPAASEYAVEPVGELTIKPSQR